MNPHNWIYLVRICPCSLAGVVERSPLWVPGSAFRSPAETTMLEGSSFSMISSNESSDFLKFSDLVGTYTEKSDVLLSRVSVIKMANGTKSVSLLFMALLSRVSVIKMANGTKICVFVIHGLHMDIVKTGVLLSTCLLLQHIVKHILLHNVL